MMDTVVEEPEELQILGDTVPVSERTAASERHYQNAKMLGTLTPLAEEPTLESFRHWRIIDNRFPYDMVYKTCHLLLPKRVAATYADLTPEEVDELHDILQGYVDGHYDRYVVNTVWKRSVHDHWHVHLLNFKASREEFGL